MKNFFILFCCHLAIGSGAAGLPAPDKTPRSDVFLITIDTLRADHVHCYGYDRVQTPSLDQLAKQGVRFTQAFTPSPITNSSHASILTGLLPSSHGVSDFGVPLAASHRTLAETLKKRGYRTAAFIGAVILDSKALAPDFDRGFEFYDNFPAQSETKSRWGRVERREWKSCNVRRRGSLRTPPGLISFGCTCTILTIRTSHLRRIPKRTRTGSTTEKLLTRIRR